jgi:hypothetical protein
MVILATHSRRLEIQIESNNLPNENVMTESGVFVIICSRDR